MPIVTHKNIMMSPASKAVTGAKMFSRDVGAPMAATGVIAPGRATLAQPAAPVVATTPATTPAGSAASGFSRQHRFGWHSRFADWLVLTLPQPRSEMKVPVSPTQDITADTLFEDPDASTGKRYYIPTFSLVEHELDGKRQFRAAMREVQEGWMLTVFFANGTRSGGTEPIQTTFTPLLRFATPTAGKELPLVLEQEDDTTWKATLLMRTLNERDEVFHALTKVDYRTQFILRCNFTAAVPVSKEGSGEQLYTASSHAVDVSLNRDPFVFDPNQHPHLFQGITNVSDRTFDLIPRQVEWKGRLHHYYQDEASPYVFYYLPDAVKITRKPQVPYTPNMLVKFTSEDGSLDKMLASVEYVAAPVVDPERLEEAARALKERGHLPSPMPAGITDAVFRPLVVKDVEQLKLTLALPRAGTSGTPRQERPGVVHNLTDSFQDEIADLTMTNFQDVFDALFGKSAVVFSGEVLVSGGGERPDAVVPFIARLDDLYGQVLEAVEAVNEDGTAQITLRNGAESPVIVRSIPVGLAADGQVLPAHIENLTKQGAAASLPAELGPAEELALTVVPDQPGAVNGTPAAIFDLDDVVVEPDPDAVWNAILDASVPAAYDRAIAVEGFEAWFVPETDVLAIGIDFENGNSVVLRPDNLKAEARVRVPVSDLVLRKVQQSEYRYTQITIRQSGQTRTQKSDTLDLLFPSPDPAVTT